MQPWLPCYSGNWKVPGNSVKSTFDYELTLRRVNEQRSTFSVYCQGDAIGYTRDTATSRAGPALERHNILTGCHDVQSRYALVYGQFERDMCARRISSPIGMEPNQGRHFPKGEPPIILDGFVEFHATYYV